MQETPAGQVSHRLVPPRLNVPFWQATWIAPPGDGQKKPGAHAVHAVDPPTLKLPAVHGAGAAEVVGHSEPGGHSMHEEADGPARL